MNKRTNYQSLHKLVRQQGGHLFGVADLTKRDKDFLLPQELLERCPAAVCVGARLCVSVLSEIENQPTKLYFHHYRTVNAFLDQLALRISNYIQDRGFLALPIPASQILDWQNQKAHLSHKHIGYLAGLGWIGRNNLLVNPSLGSQFRLVTLLTDMPLMFDKPLDTGCGTCRLCVEVCPAQAIKENVADFDHIKCFEKLKEFQRQRIVDQYICGVCVKACIGKGKVQRGRKI